MTSEITIDDVKVQSGEPIDDEQAVVISSLNDKEKDDNDQDKSEGIGFCPW